MTNLHHWIKGILVTLFTLCAFTPYTQACTDFRVQAKDGSIIIARSMEFGMDLHSHLRSSIQGRVYKTTAPDGKPGITWKAKYGYLFLDGMNMDVAIDGMNEKGLSFEALYLPELAQYQTVATGQDNKALPYIMIGDWILSNFATIDEVRQALPNVVVFSEKLPGLGDMVFPLHFSIYDNTGKGLVVEYIGGKMTIYDNLGVLTNSPSYDWHLTNLVNYIHLAPTNPSPVIANGMTFAATGQGFGMIGLPGDISPPSRFVKIATLLHVAIPADDAAGAINLAEHVINNVDIVLGEAREPTSGSATGETTEWTVFKDLTHRIFYYRTYHDTSLRAVALGQINFAPNASRLMMSIESKESVQDLTQEFLKSPQMDATAPQNTTSNS